MKIQVVIEATSIQEYTEAIQALAAGYTVQAPVINVVAGSMESAKTVDSDEIKVAEEKPKRNRTRAAANKPVKEVEKAAAPTEAPKTEKPAATPKTEEKTESDSSDTSEYNENAVSFVDVKLKAKQLANLPDGKSDIKFILDKLDAKKLSDLEEDQYATFMEEAEKAMHVHTDPVKGGDAPKEGEEEKPVETGQDSGENKPATLEMIRGLAKALSVQGYKEEIKALLKEYNAAALTKIPKDKYDEFHAAMVAINE